jgi:DNA-binding NtrC family response regulator
MSANLLAGRDVLLVEDETLISFLVEDMLRELGAGSIRHAARLSIARELIAQNTPALAVLDVNVAGDLVFPLAESLVALGVPLLFTTGYGRAGFDARWAAAEVMQKPFNLASLERALRRVLKDPAHA